MNAELPEMSFQVKNPRRCGRPVAETAVAFTHDLRQQIGGLMFLNRPRRLSMLFALLLAAGCSSTDGGINLIQAQSAGNNPINIESEPSGADVYVMGEKIGVTPLKINPQDVFPTTYPKEKEPLYGKVTLKKAGCSDFTKTVSMKITNVGLHAQLQCGDMNPASSPTTKAAPDISESVEQRLEKIRDLQNKGLITEEEAKKARERVLNDL